jgi:hypothetical protein
VTEQTDVPTPPQDQRFQWGPQPSRVRYAQELTPAEHFKRAQELAWDAEHLDRYEDDQTTPLLAALVHGVLAIAGQLTPRRVEFIPPTATTDGAPMDADEVLARAAAAGKRWAGGQR